VPVPIADNGDADICCSVWWFWLELVGLIVDLGELVIVLVLLPRTYGEGSRGGVAARGLGGLDDVPLARLP
jgi:hypothetical protein